MTDQNTFIDTINSVADIIRTSGEMLSEEEILAYFNDMELDDNQKKLVLEYLLNPQHVETMNDNEEKEEVIKEYGNTGDSQENEKEDSARSAVFKMYLEELSYLPVYSKVEKEQMYQDLLQGNKGVISKLSDCWLERVIAVAKTYIEPKLNVEDLVQEGNMALFLALQELCGSMKKVNMEEVLEGAIEEGIMAYASEMNNEREQEKTILGKVSLIHEAKKLLTEENGYEPALEELADYTKISVEELEDVMDMLKATDVK